MHSVQVISCHQAPPVDKYTLVFCVKVSRIRAGRTVLLGIARVRALHDIYTEGSTFSGYKKRVTTIVQIRRVPRILSERTDLLPFY